MGEPCQLADFDGGHYTVAHADHAGWVTESFRKVPILDHGDAGGECAELEQILTVGSRTDSPQVFGRYWRRRRSKDGERGSWQPPGEPRRPAVRARSPVSRWQLAGWEAGEEPGCRRRPYRKSYQHFSRRSDRRAPALLSVLGAGLGGEGTLLVEAEWCAGHGAVGEGLAAVFAAASGLPCLAASAVRLSTLPKIAVIPSLTFFPAAPPVAPPTAAAPYSVKL